MTQIPADKIVKYITHDGHGIVSLMLCFHIYQIMSRLTEEMCNLVSCACLHLDTYKSTSTAGPFFRYS